MHCSGIRTVRCSGRLGKGVSAQGWGCLSGGGVWPGRSLPGGVSPGGCLPRGCLPRENVCPSACWETPPPWTEWRAGIKSLPCRNYVADGNNQYFNEECGLHYVWWCCLGRVWVTFGWFINKIKIDTRKNRYHCIFTTGLMFLEIPQGVSVFQNAHYRFRR